MVAPAAEGIDQELVRVAEEQPVGAAGVDSFCANSPVVSAPTVPPTPCTPKASRESS